MMMMMMMKVGTVMLEEVGGDCPNTRSPQPVYKPVQPHPLVFQKFTLKIFQSILSVFSYASHTSKKQNNADSAFPPLKNLRKKVRKSWHQILRQRCVYLI